MKQNHLFIENNFIIYKKTPEVLLVKDIKTKKIWRYKKSSQTFETVLNQYTVVGTYQGNIQFFDDGRVDGLKQFTHYNICYAGDCETQNETSKNLIIFSNAQNENVYVAWQFTTKKTLELYQLKNAAVPGDMPVYKLQKKWMVLKKNK